MTRTVRTYLPFYFALALAFLGSGLFGAEPPAVIEGVGVWVSGSETARGDLQISMMLGDDVRSGVELISQPSGAMLLLVLSPEDSSSRIGEQAKALASTTGPDGKSAAIVVTPTPGAAIRVVTPKRPAGDDSFEVRLIDPVSGQRQLLGAPRINGIPFAFSSRIISEHTQEASHRRSGIVATR